MQSCPEVFAGTDMKAFIVYGIPAIVLFLVMVGGKVYSARKDKKRKLLLEKCRTVTGRVRLVDNRDAPLGYGSLNRKWELEAEFEYGGRTYFAFADRQRQKPEYKVGDEIIVYFDPKHPEDNVILL